jgi:superfamily I DNA and/or RNA helicase
MLVEEAGQVLEAHVLGSLVPSVEHLILIGDPLQLRPTLNNYCEIFLVRFFDISAVLTLT